MARQNSGNLATEAGSAVFVELKPWLYVCTAYDATSSATDDHQAVRQFRAVRAHAQMRVRPRAQCPAQDAGGDRRLGCVAAGCRETVEVFALWQTPMHGIGEARNKAGRLALAHLRLNLVSLSKARIRSQTLIAA